MVRKYIYIFLIEFLQMLLALKERNASATKTTTITSRKPNNLKITSFLNNLPLHSQNAFFKACTHPLAVEKINNFITELSALESVAIYDPFNNAPALFSLHDFSEVKVSNVYVQQVASIGLETIEHIAKPVDEIKLELPKALAVIAFNTEILVSNIRHLLPEDCKIFTLDSIKIANEYLSKPSDYLSPLNFATNFGFMRDENGLHTRITIANYWGCYGATDAALYLCLFNENGKELTSWQQSLGGAGEQIILDSEEIRERFGLSDFVGSLFMHATKIVGHDIVKYVVDVYDTKGEVLSVTHDSNSWPADYYAGIGAPQEGEKVILWIQNCHPIAISAGTVGVRLMGQETTSYLEEEIAPYATKAWDLGQAMPAKWPAQYEIIAQKYFTRPRFEVIYADGNRHISHANVERTDLVPDTNLQNISKYLGKGYILPLPLMNTNDYETLIMPTPMATSQKSLPLHFYIYDRAGNLVEEKTFPSIAREESVVISAEILLGTKEFTGGHVEMAYNPENLAEADGWLHALVRYRNKKTGRAAESSFGAHIYNMPIVYKNEPQTYKGNPPGVRTTLVLRTLGGNDTFCNLIYPCSKEWVEQSSTDLILNNSNGKEVARKQIKININGSTLWTYKQMFNEVERTKAGENSYIIIKDTTCRLFGFHGQVNDKTFSLDHMFGF
jgi:hypothetical protein